MVNNKRNCNLNLQYSTIIEMEETKNNDETSGTIDEGGEHEEKSGTLDGYCIDEEKSGTLDGCGEEEVESCLQYNVCDEEVKSGIIAGCGGDEKKSLTFAEFDEDEYYCHSIDGNETSSSDMSFSGKIEKQMIRGLEGLNTTAQTLERIWVGQIYDSKEELQFKLRMITIFQNFDYTTIKSTKTLLVLNCYVPGCSWRIRASTIRRSSQFKVRKYIDIHTCPVTKRCSRHRQATSKCFGELYLAKFGKISVGIRPMHIMDVMKAMYGIDIDYWKAYKALVHAREMVRGTWESGYADLPSFLHRIKAANPGTITELECDEEDRFKYLFIAFGACINGFQFIRNVIVVDGTHLKGKFLGVLLVAVGQDGNGKIFPLAFGIVDSENDVAWEWFLTQLRTICPDHQELVLISDRHKSIGKTISKVFPLAHRGICTYHLHQNLLKNYKGSSLLILVKRAMRAYRVSEFTTIFNEIRIQKPELATYLEKVDVRLWSRANFPGNRYGIMTSNIAESMNKVLLNAREYPIACLLDELRKLISKWFMRRRERAMSQPTLFTPKVEKTLKIRTVIANTLYVQHIDAHRSHVTGGDLACVVDLQQMRCTCRVYNIDKIPCEHALAAAMKRPNLSEETLIHRYYTKIYWYNAYVESINPEDVELESPLDIANKRCLPPEEIRGAGVLVIDKQHQNALESCIWQN
ncbi:PREDICTED: uncharacterized protein LOC104704236 [Camelina sativa]|uniref:Uncharacterized protein LOC104704236 n=1 Tax=Camelina sativa TaxID=90675 RepID=A0ABM0T023_CAMSA|nr:PREDICTED: uncharacterized protein LOC104704236 [Camelina sativa]